jgi:hypothetical protein
VAETDRARDSYLLTKRPKNKNKERPVQMPEASQMLDALKNSLRNLERVRMTAPNDPELLALKQQIQKMIEKLASRTHE